MNVSMLFQLKSATASRRRSASSTWLSPTHSSLSRTVLKSVTSSHCRWVFVKLQSLTVVGVHMQCAVLQCGKDVDSKHVQWQALEGLGALAFNAGNFDKAIEYFKQALAIFTLSGAAKSTVRVDLLGPPA